MHTVINVLAQNMTSACIVTAIVITLLVDFESKFKLKFKCYEHYTGIHVQTGQGLHKLVRASVYWLKPVTICTCTCTWAVRLSLGHFLNI